MDGVDPAPEPPRSADLRAGDADRAEVLERLRMAHTEGRLDLSELDARVAATIAARTYGDLAPLVADLPGGPPPVRPVAEPTSPPVRGARATPPDRPPGAAGEVSLATAVGSALVMLVLAATLGALLFGSSFAVAGYLAAASSAFFLAAWAVTRLRGGGDG